MQLSCSRMVHLERSTGGLLLGRNAQDVLSLGRVTNKGGGVRYRPLFIMAGTPSYRLVSAERIE